MSTVVGGGGILLSLFSTDESVRLALLVRVECTALLNAIDQYFRADTLFLLVLPVQVRRHCRKHLPALELINSEYFDVSHSS